MRIWGIICLLGVIAEANAHKAEKPDIREERAGIATSTHFDEDNFHKASSADYKAESSAAVRESSESFLSSQEEAPEPFIIVTTEKVSPPGGGVPMLDPNVVREMPIPAAEASWWNQLIDGIVGLFVDDYPEKLMNRKNPHLPNDAN